MPKINIHVKDRVATAANDPVIVCGNNDYTVNFLLDDEWSGFTTRACVILYKYGNVWKNMQVLFEGSECTLPALRGVSYVCIGLTAGDVRTTTPAVVSCLESITDHVGVTEPPPKDIWGQILDKIDRIETGVVPVIGENGNWFIGGEDTEKPSRGEQGAEGERGADGKSAYQYAQDGGYTGTAADFAKKLAAEFPAMLPNPHSLTLTGAVSAIYDGSCQVTAEIPSGGKASDFALVGVVDFSQANMAVVNSEAGFELSDASEILLISNSLVNGSSVNSAVLVYIEQGSEKIRLDLAPASGKSGTPLSGWVFLKRLPGVGLTGVQSAGALSASNYRTGNALIPYNILPLPPAFRINKISIANPPTQYFTVGGTVAVYAR